MAGPAATGLGRRPVSTSSVPDPIRIDVWSDIACPWGYIGKRKLELAVAGLAEDADAAPVEVVVRSYELMPDLPSDSGGSTVDLLGSLKGLAAEQLPVMHDQVAGIAAEAGLHDDFASQQPTNMRKPLQALAERTYLQALAERTYLPAMQAEWRDGAAA